MTGISRRLITFVLTSLLAGAVALSSCAGEPLPEPGSEPAAPEPTAPEPVPAPELVEKGYQANMTKNNVVIRAVRSETGGEAFSEQTGFGPQYRMWADEINREGGLYIKSLDRRVPVDVQIYDDESDTDNTKRLFEEIVGSERPDLVLPPFGEDKLFAVAPIAQRHDYLLIAGEGSSLELIMQLDAIRADYGEANTFLVRNNAEKQVPALAKLFRALGVDSVYGVYVNDFYNVEYWSATEAALAEAFVEITGSEAVDPEDFDAAAIIENAITSGAKAFVCFAGPEQSVPVMNAAIALEYRPEAYFTGEGVSSDYYSVDAWGDYTREGLTGVMGLGAWNEKSGPGAKEYNDRFRGYWTEKGLFWLDADGLPADSESPVYQDWWIDICCYSGLQILQQAVENAGELDENGMIKNSTLITYINGGAVFDTAMNPALVFEDNRPAGDMFSGNIGQWQNGVFEVIDADHRRTADPLYPKPPWSA